MKKILNVIDQAVMLFMLPVIGLVFSLFDLFAIYFGFNSTVEPMIKWPAMALLVVVMPYLIYPFFQPLINHLKNKKLKMHIL